MAVATCACTRTIVVAGDSSAGGCADAPVVGDPSVDAVERVADLGPVAEDGDIGAMRGSKDVADAVDVAVPCTPGIDPDTGKVATNLLWDKWSATYGFSGYLSSKSDCGNMTVGFTTRIPSLIASDSGAWVVSPIADMAAGQKSNWLLDFARRLLFVRHLSPLPLDTTPTSGWGYPDDNLGESGVKAMGPVLPGATMALWSPWPLIHGAGTYHKPSANTHALVAAADQVDAIVVNVSAAIRIRWVNGSPPQAVVAPDHPMAGQEQWEAIHSEDTFPWTTQPISHLVTDAGQSTLFVLHRPNGPEPLSLHAWPITEAGFGDHHALVTEGISASATFAVVPRKPGEVWLAIIEFPKDFDQYKCGSDLAKPKPPCAAVVKIFAASASQAQLLGTAMVPRNRWYHSLGLGGNGGMVSSAAGIALVPLDADHLGFVGHEANLYVWSPSAGLVPGGALAPLVSLTWHYDYAAFASLRGPQGSWVVLLENDDGLGMGENVVVLQFTPTQGIAWATPLPTLLGSQALDCGAAGVVRNDGHTFVYGEKGFIEVDERGNRYLNPLCFGANGPNCDDGDPCTFDRCDAKGDCQHTAKGDGTLCAMGPPKVCKAGQCGPL
ncbi:MAG: hypothetical protein HY902_05970 [Deltaproteobacteria bacterium]|nr:hypothetical protein [Deltaproteobacteria bacterium]